MYVSIYLNSKSQYQLINTYSTLYTMFPNTSTQSRTYSKTAWLCKTAVPESWIIARLEVKLEENSIYLQIGSPGNFPGKGKVPVTIGKTREEGTTLERGCLLLVTMEQVWLLLKSLKEKRLDAQLHLHLHAVELYHGQSIYSLLQIYLSWMELRVLSQSDIRISDAGPLVQCHECSQSTTLACIQQFHPPHPGHSL